MRQPSMEHERQYFSICKVGDYVYVVGGYNRNFSILSSCERFNLLGRKWEPVEDLTEARMNCALASIGDEYIYAFGGLKDGSTIE